MIEQGTSPNCRKQAELSAKNSIHLLNFFSFGKFWKSPQNIILGNNNWKAHWGLKEIRFRDKVFLLVVPGEKARKVLLFSLDVSPAISSSVVRCWQLYDRVFTSGLCGSVTRWRISINTDRQNILSNVILTTALTTIIL